MNGQQLLVLFKKNPISSVCCFASLLMAAFIYFRSDALATAEEDLKQKTALGQRYSTNLIHSAQLKEQYETLVAANRDIEARFAKVGQLAQNLQYFYKLEADTGVKMTVNQLTQSNTQPSPNAKRILVPVAFSVSAQGEYASVLEFLRRLESGVHINRVLVGTLNAAGTAGENGASRSVTLNLSLELLGVP